MKKIIWFSMYLLLYTVTVVFYSSCSDDESPLRNDLLRKDAGPVLVGNTLEFAYAIGSTDGTSIKAVEITASFPGAEGTGIAMNSRYTNPNNGEEEEVRIATETSTEGTVSKAYIVDTIAATIRYFYVVPKEAKGNKIRFHFRSITEGGEATIQSPEYTVSSVEIFKNLSLSSGERNCFSLETMQSYSVAQVEELGIADKIDFIYTFKSTMGSGWSFAHGLVAPSNEKGYLYPVEIPSGATNRTLMEKRYWPDGQLKTSGVPTIYVDEIDLRQAALDGVTTHAYELGQDQGVLIKSHDQKYIAYLYINETSSNLQRMNFAIKRLTLK